MPICKPNELIAAISPGQRLLGLDVGKKTIGLALSDRGLKIATADNILWRSKFTKDAIILFDLIDREEIGGLVIGWPLNMDGSAGPRCDSTRDFAHALMKIRDLPVLLQDERLSTRAVDQAMLAADLTRQRRAQRRDALAATWILQSALDSFQIGPGTEDTG